ncbi:unnamed protein product [Peronospora destructor]|uniref:Uncharacterized protein n=1 Tax=Peronospora destructor TaxID=86335 RepID=A0AAV0UKB3_9STRA|nr:unnamed protein product [Peronospora destructor]
MVASGPFRKVWAMVSKVGAQELDEFWEKLVLGAIGELIDPANENNKKDKKDSSNNYRFEIWLRGVSRAEADEICNKTLEVVNPGSLGAPWCLMNFEKRMKREDGVMRLDQVENKLNVVQERYDKDLVLAQAVQEIRDRLRRLEEEGIVSRQNAAKVATAVSSKVDKEKTQPLEMSPPSESKVDVALAVLKSNEQSDERAKGRGFVL